MRRHLMLQSLMYLLRILPQIEDCRHQDASRVRFVKNAVRKPAHHLASDLLEVAWGDLRKNSDPGQICINRRHELHTESFAVLFTAVENPLQVGVGSREELNRQGHRDPRMRSLTCSHATTSAGCRR